MKSTNSIVTAAMITIAALSTTFAGPEWQIGESGDASMKLSFLGQVHASFNENAADEEDIFLRRGRFILQGQIADGIKFFAETDNDNAGKAGSDVSTDIQDAFIDIQIADSDHWVEVGLILLPFSFENRSSAASLLGLDYNSETIKFVNTFVWRDYGAEIHGSFGDRVSYCAGVFDGYDAEGSTKNPAAGMRYTGHIAFNILGTVEKGWFFSQERLADSGHYLSVGAGADYQEKATSVTDEMTAAETVTDSEAFVLDFQSGFELCENARLTLNGAYYIWDNASFDGATAFAEAGVKVKQTMITGKYSLQAPKHLDDTEDFTAGLHYFLEGHKTRAGVEYRWGDSDETVLAGIQFLL